MANILIAEDDQHIRDLIILTLELNRHSVVPTRNGLEAVEAVGQVSAEFDLVILDVRMPELNGIEAAEQIRQVSQFEQTPILFLSGDDTLEEIGIAHSFILHKPFPIDALLKLIRDIVNKEV